MFYLHSSTQIFTLIQLNSVSVVSDNSFLIRNKWQIELPQNLCRMHRQNVQMLNRNVQKDMCIFFSLFAGFFFSFQIFLPCYILKTVHDNFHKIIISMTNMSLTFSLLGAIVYIFVTCTD